MMNGENRQIYHDINAQTQLLGIIGYPLSHTMSPLMHNRAFQAMEINAVYIAFPFANASEALGTLEKIGVQGLSVTIPHKEAVLSLVKEIDPLAKAIGAANTLKRLPGGAWHASNTDGWGAWRALTGGDGALSWHRALILGTGGAARAVAFTLAEKMPELGFMFASRDEGRSQRLMQDLRRAFGNRFFWIQSAKLGEEPSFCHDFDLVVNVSPVGMYPDVLHSPLSRRCIFAHQTVFDTIYNPESTLLLQFAQEAGARTVLGKEMLLYQGVRQFEIFTGSPAPIDVMRDALR